MDPALISLIAASTTFVGTHFVMSHPLRGWLVGLLGEAGFMGLYSVVSAACMGWMYWAFMACEPGPPLWGGYGDAVWAFATAVTWLAMVLLCGSLVRNPALPAPGAKAAALAAPHGVFQLTRHPMMWGFALWAIAHIVAAPTPRTLVVAIAILILALVGAHLQDRKKEELMGEPWVKWEMHTHFWPRWSKLFAVGLFPLLGGTVVWLAASWAHIPLGGWQAGIWRWL